MGSIDLVRLVEPAYKCRVCETHIGVPTDIIFGVVSENENVYVFTTVYNTDLVAMEGYVCTRKIHCANCSTHIGYFYLGAYDYAPENYFIPRTLLYGPEGSSDDEA